MVKNEPYINNKWQHFGERVGKNIETYQLTGIAYSNSI